MFFSGLALFTVFQLIAWPNKFAVMQFDEIFYPLLLTATTAFCGYAIYGCMKKMLSRKAEVELSDKGILLNQDLFSEWHKFEAYRSLSFSRQSGIVLTLKDPDAFKNSIQNHPRRFVLNILLNKREFGSPFVIESSRLKCDAALVEAFVAKYLPKKA